MNAVAEKLNPDINASSTRLPEVANDATFEIQSNVANNIQDQSKDTKEMSLKIGEKSAGMDNTTRFDENTDNHIDPTIRIKGAMPNGIENIFQVIMMSKGGGEEEVKGYAELLNVMRQVRQVANDPDYKQVA